MVTRLCSDGDGVQVVVGPPGTGKTFALDAAREAWQASGFVVCGAAVARQAARGMWDAAGDPEHERRGAARRPRARRRMGLSARTVLVVDEAGMLGTRDLAQLLAHAAPAGRRSSSSATITSCPRSTPAACFARSWPEPTRFGCRSTAASSSRTRARCSSCGARRASARP